MNTKITEASFLLQLEKVKENMKSQTASGDAVLDGSLDYLMATGGKMLRPTFLLIGSRMGKSYMERESEIIKLATAIETIHLATLIHDDIIDEATMRRGRASIQGKYGQSYAVYMGDYLLSQCFLMLTNLNLEKSLAINLAKVVTRICLGDMKQNQLRYDVKITPYKYIKMVSGKTAALFSVAMSSGAYYAGADEKDVKILSRIGYEIGMAFQLVDDLLDFEGDIATVGKEVQVDVRRGYYSMPIIFALQNDNPYSERLKLLLGQDMDDDSIEEMFEIVRLSGGIEQTRSLANKYHMRAMALLEKLPIGETRTMLENMIPPLLSRMS
ncbi:Heptaprenyl diphosphate synthase [Petrocella atlantisensis]|uniref:Heptaprenyl diphosphate synthase n=1 Tax=Petrocella atlantisensis TaxID=2173034 RepID=A0A3P7P1K5_9FIRM|nr:polyprenyl synthetase family protein [Petrocella atlantisensis]VDN49015.1 Heptaprenyl diphosphate synthase [Petrocella atlantisensis]